MQFEACVHRFDFGKFVSIRRSITKFVCHWWCCCLYCCCCFYFAGTTTTAINTTTVTFELERETLANCCVSVVAFFSSFSVFLFKYCNAVAVYLNGGLLLPPLLLFYVWHSDVVHDGWRKIILYTIIRLCIFGMNKNGIRQPYYSVCVLMYARLVVCSVTYTFFFVGFLLWLMNVAEHLKWWY